jgi:hypothetical protein
MPEVVRPFALCVLPDADSNGNGPRVAWLGLEVDGEEAFLFRREADNRPSFMAAESAERACRLVSRVAPTRVVWLTDAPLDVSPDGAGG